MTITPARRDMTDASYLNAIPSALIAVDRKLVVVFVNPAAEQLFGISAQQAVGRALHDFPAFDEALCDRCEHIFATGEAVTLFEQALRIPMHHKSVTMHISPVETAGRVAQLLITIEKADGLDLLSASKWKQETTRATGVMAAMLAHEIKNPLSGIRGAAQLLKEELTQEHQPLTDLICRESDRISDLLSQVEMFANGAPETGPVNIHEVLQYVISIAQTSFARHVTFKEKYDPSLPQVAGHRDLMVQLFLNLVKNASEALAGKEDATITLSTAYKSGYRIRRDNPLPPRGGGLGRGGALNEFDVRAGGELPLSPPSPTRGEGEKVPLPIMVGVEDNGAGIPEAIRARLFEPFVSSREDGRGLGLAVVAKIASDLGAVAELDEEFDGGTRFAVWLAVG